MRFTTKDTTIEAVQVTKKNRADLLALDERVHNILVENADTIEIVGAEIAFDDDERPVQAHVGSWIVRHEDGNLSIITDGLFDALLAEKG